MAPNAGTAGRETLGDEETYLARSHTNLELATKSGICPAVLNQHISCKRSC